MTCRLEPHPLGIAVRTPFNRNFVYDLKDTIPSHERKWDADHKIWIVAPKHGQVVQDLCRRYFHETPAIPTVKLPVEKRRGTIKLLYVGSAKEREDGSSTAFGMHYDTKEWSVVFPEDVLRNWFDNTPLEEKDETSLLPKNSYYLVLGLKKIVDDQDEIKSAYRRMARQWHPDVCKEPDANERFKIINEAYQALSDPRKKKLYDLGQKMVDSSATARNQKKRSHFYTDPQYKPALRCGIIDCDYEVVMGRAIVARIHAWSDIVERGRVLVTSWVMGATEPLVAWV